MVLSILEYKPKGQARGAQDQTQVRKIPEEILFRLPLVLYIGYY
jgi:hypothetical protein